MIRDATKIPTPKSQKGKPIGPFSPQRIREGIASGEIKKEAQIWRPPWTEWTNIANVFPTELGLTADFVAEMEENGEILHKP